MKTTMLFEEKQQCAECLPQTTFKAQWNALQWSLLEHIQD